MIHAVISACTKPAIDFSDALQRSLVLVQDMFWRRSRTL